MLSGLKQTLLMIHSADGSRLRKPEIIRKESKEVDHTRRLSQIPPKTASNNAQHSSSRLDTSFTESAYFP